MSKPLTKMALIQPRAISLHCGGRHAATWAYEPPLLQETVDFVLSLEPRTLTPMRPQPQAPRGAA